MKEGTAGPKKDSKKPAELDAAQITAKIESAKSLAKQVRMLSFVGTALLRAAMLLCPLRSFGVACEQGSDLDLVQGDTAAAQEALLAIEKQCRLAEDMKLSQDACTAVLDVLQAAGDWKGLLEHITMLTKRRGQLKSTIQVLLQDQQALNKPPVHVYEAVSCCLQWHVSQR